MEVYIWFKKRASIPLAPCTVPTVAFDLAGTVWLLGLFISSALNSEFFQTICSPTVALSKSLMFNFSTLSYVSFVFIP